jgi:hypothetical protein
MLDRSEDSKLERLLRFDLVVRPSVAAGDSLEQSLRVQLEPPTLGPGTIWRGRARRSSALRQAFVAIRYSHARNEESPLKLARLSHARRNVSCIRSSESSYEPSIRYV